MGLIKKMPVDGIWILTGPVRYAQVSWDARPKSPGVERAWTTENSAANDSNERMSAVSAGREGTGKE